MDMTAKKLSGWVGCPVTPFTRTNDVDLERFAALVGFMTRAGHDAVVVAMHVGESLNLSMDERKALAEAAVAGAAGRIPVYVHASMPGTDAAIELARHADSVGAAGSVVITPYHWHPSPEALVAHFVSVANATSGDVLLYNYPERLGVTVTMDILRQVVRQCDNVIGLKTADLHLEYFTEACRVGRELRPDFSVFSGVEYPLPGMAVGAAGTFSVCGSIAPRLIRQLVDACIAGDAETALPLQHRVSALYHLLKPGYPARIKAALSILDRSCGPVRQPLTSLDIQEEKVLEAELDALGILADEPHGW